MKNAKQFVFSSYTAKIPCPYCDHENTGWLNDPRGAEATCEECGEKFKIPADIEIDIG